MSDNETSKAKSGWTDKERLTYLFSLIDYSDVKFNYNATPRPTGRSVIACQRMVERLKGTLKNELEALKNGTAMPEGDAPKTPKKPASTPRKRRTKADGGADGEAATPTKKSRKNKGVVPEPEVEDDEEMMKVKGEPEFGDGEEA